MPQTDAPATPAPKAPAARRPKPDAPSAPARAALYAVTVDITEGRFVAVERIEEAGARRALTAAEKADLAETWDQPVRRLFEEAFEAGIACVLGDAADAESPPDGEEGELSRVLLDALIEESGDQALPGEAELDRRIVGALIGQAVKRAVPA